MSGLNFGTIVGGSFVALFVLMGLLAIAAALNGKDWHELTEETWHD